MPPLPEASALVGTIRCRKPPGEETRCPGPSWVGVGGRPGRQLVKYCLPTTIINERKRWRGLLSGLILFRLVAPPLLPRVVGPYSVWGVWFCIHLLLEGTGHIKKFCVVPEVLDPGKHLPYILPLDLHVSISIFNVTIHSFTNQCIGHNAS
jgi:hypothetical protein